MSDHDARPRVFQCLWNAHLQQYQVSTHVEHAPWVDHAHALHPKPDHVHELETRVLASLGTRTIRAEDEVLTLAPSVMGIRIAPKPDGKQHAWVNISWLEGGVAYWHEQIEVDLAADHPDLHETHTDHVAQHEALQTFRLRRDA